MSDSRKPVIVLSAVNLTTGGPLTVAQDCFEYASRELSQSYRIIGLVHGGHLFPYSGIELIEFPTIKGSWLKRLWAEFKSFNQLSRRWDVSLWFSLSDISPRVRTRSQAVYCHNPAPFYPFEWKYLRYEPKVALFQLFYRYLYQLNLTANNFVVVQQNWLRNEFASWIAREKIIVAHPSKKIEMVAAHADSNRGNQKIKFIYPVLPRVSKNFEVIFEAVEILKGNENLPSFEVILTTRGDENSYVRALKSRFNRLSEMAWIGSQTREAVFKLYQESDALLFPSLLETWGMPMMEFRNFNKPILAADRPYARETLAGYEHSAFFDPKNPLELARLMEKVIRGEPCTQSTPALQPEAPFARNWKELFQLLLANEPKV